MNMQMEASGGQSRRTTRNISSCMRAILLLYCLLMTTTALLGSGQSLSCFMMKPTCLLFSINEYWFYLMYSFAVGLAFVWDLHFLVLQTKDLVEVVSYLLIHSYLIVNADIVMLTYYFCVALLSKDCLIQKVTLYCTLLLRLALCYLFIRLIQCKLTY